MKSFKVEATFPDGFKLSETFPSLTVGLASSAGYQKLSRSCPPERSMADVISLHIDLIVGEGVSVPAIE